MVGHKKQFELLKAALERNHLPHTLLFSGTQGIGKRVVALKLAEVLLAADQTAKLSGLFWRGEHPDLHLIGLEEDKKDISVEQARDFISALQLRPYLGRRRVAIIDDAHLLSIAASNALLLTLEEAPNDCFIILVTHSPQRLLPTILSRSQELSFPDLSRVEVNEILSALGSPPELIDTLLELSDHSLELFDLASTRKGGLQSSDQKLVVKQLEKSVPYIRDLQSQIEFALSSKNTANLLSLASQLGEKDNSNELVFRLLIRNVRDKVVSGNATEKLSEALEQLIQLEKSTRTRNLNPVIQLSDFFIQNFA